MPLCARLLIKSLGNEPLSRPKFEFRACDCVGRCVRVCVCGGGVATGGVGVVVLVGSVTCSAVSAKSETKITALMQTQRSIK